VSLARFAAPTMPIAEQWYRTPIQSISVTCVGPFSLTADGACQVHLPDGSVAYLKPRPGAERNLMVAREKIASDLARLLDLPVAPVVVRTPDPSAGWNHHSALSLACLPAARPWAHGGAAHLDRVASTLERLRVFWTWIADSDHNGHGGNLLFEIRPDGCAVIAIDHSWSFGHDNNIDPLAFSASTGYGTARRDDCRPALQTIMTDIQSLGWDTIETIVRRLAGILTVPEQDRILHILRERRTSLRRLLGVPDGELP
jgi:hypothetical protein